MTQRLHQLSLALLAVCAAMAAVPGPAKANSACEKTYEAMQKTMAGFDPVLATTASDIKRTQQAGLDPNRYIVDYDGMLVQLTVKFHDMVEKVVSQSIATSGGSAACRQDLTPYLRMAELKAIYQNYGLTALVPPEMASTDYLQVLRGGQVPAANAAFMPAGNSMPMQQMAIGGMVAKMIKKPYCVFGACSAEAPF